MGVPGELRGFETAWKKHGSLPWKDLFEPAIEMATKGFRAPRALVNAVRLNAGNISLDHGLRYVSEAYKIVSLIYKNPIQSFSCIALESSIYIVL